MAPAAPRACSATPASAAPGPRRTAPVCGFCDDLYAPKSAEFIAAFSEGELKDLAHLYGVLCEAAKAPLHSVSELRKPGAWQPVIVLAKELDAHCARTP